MGKILLADDDTAMRLTVARVFAECRARGHCGGRWTAVPGSVPGVTCGRGILDIFMPHKDGLETLIELRREFPHVSVVAMSGHRASGLMLKAAKGLGAVRTLSKPFEPEALLALVAEELDWVREGIKARASLDGGRTAA